MAFGIILEDRNPFQEKANFYVPTISLQNKDASADSFRVSHVFLKSLFLSVSELISEILDSLFPAGVTILIRLPELDEFKKIYHALKSLSRKTAIIVPVIEDLRFLFMLRDICVKESGAPGLILEFHTAVPRHIIYRYKCLGYMAIYVSSLENNFAKYIANLMTKSSIPVLLLSQKVSALKLYLFWRSLSISTIPSWSDVLIDPLQPLSVDMELDVYETFEKDHRKYTQYEHAIEMAISDLCETQNMLNILVIGPGRGPLLEMVMKFTRRCDHVVAVEKNAKCHLILAELCKKWPQKVELIEGDVRQMDRAKLGKFNLVVSEMLGSFGCNEAAPEILNVFRDFSPVMIPQEVRSYVQPIYTDLPFDEHLNRPYLVQLNSFYKVCEPAIVFEFVYPGINELSQEKTMVFKAEHGEIANCLYGYFEADLYGPYRIGILPGQGNLEYCHSWFPMLFPTFETAFPVLITFKRKSDSRLTYEWVINGTSYGADYDVDLD